MPASSLHKRFWEKVNKNGRRMPHMKTRCYEWTAGVNEKGYGRIRLNGQSHYAHRVTWLLAHGRWPNPQALHKCDNSACVRLTHLFEGTQRDNLRDSVSKGRAAIAPGVAHHLAKLNLSKAQKIKALYAKGDISQVKLGKLFGVSQMTVSLIVQNKRWSSHA